MIVGAGSVGYFLAQGLSYKHDVIIVDKNIDKLRKIDENLDILTLHGDIQNPDIYDSLHFNSIDIFIAVTDSDEANLLSTLIIDEAVEVKKKIIRLKNEHFLNSSILKRINIDDAVFPDILIAQKVKALFDFPKVNNVKEFVQFEQKLISIKIHYDGKNRYFVNDLVDRGLFIVGIEREKSFFIPLLDEELKEKDLIYLFGDGKIVKEVSLNLDCKMPKQIENVVIFGANKSAQNIAKSLKCKELEIKMIEKDINLCNEASEFLQDGVSIINASFGEHELFESEKLKYADMVIAASENDEKNIVKCIEARGYGIEKVVALNNDSAYYGLMHQLGIVVVRGSKVATRYYIMDNISSSSIVSVQRFCGGLAVMFIRKIYPNSKLISFTLKAPKFHKFHIYQIRDKQIFQVEDFKPLIENDTIVLFGAVENEEEMHKWIYSL
jgi:trk system potassium uptake protein TrkA